MTSNSTRVSKHKHHIIPQYEGGSDFAENLVELTVTQHAMWHFAEWQRKNRWQDRIAWMGLAGIIGHEEAVSQAITESWKNRDPRVGWNHTEETKRKISQSQIGKVIPADARSKMSVSAKNRCTPEWRERQSRKLKGKEARNKGVPMSEEQKEKLRKTAGHPNKQGWLWWTNGSKTIRSREKPGPEWRRGRK